MVTEPSPTFGALLASLKARTGYSYTWLAQKTGVSRATLHRYCNGGSLPEDFAVVERIAKACSATSEELTELFRLWSQPEQQPTEEEPEQPRPAVLPRARRWWPYGSAAAAVILLAATIIVAVRQDSTPSAKPGFVWTRPPVTVKSSFFGVTLNSTSGNMPGFQVGAVRLWDSGTRWASIEYRPDTYKWSTLDRHVSGANDANLPVLFTLGGTPQWAAPTAPVGPYSDGSRAALPDNPADLDDFLTKVVTRYRGRIEAYELWALANDPRFYNGSVESLVEMTRRAAHLIRSHDPSAKVICPSMGRLWLPEARQILLRFAQLGGYQYCDAAGVKLFQKTASDPPETMLDLVELIDATFHRAGIHPMLWNTGTTFEIPLERQLGPDVGANYVPRFFLTGLAARYQRMYFYNWGGTKIPIVLQGDGGVPTKAAQNLAYLQQWLRDSSLTSCGNGALAGLPVTVWECRFVHTADGSKFLIRWSSRGEVPMDADPGLTSMQPLGGAVVQVVPGMSLRVSETPVLLTTR